MIILAYKAGDIMNKEEIGAILKKMRLDSGMTQKEVAERLGRNQPIIGHWESGYSQPDANTLFTLCDIYGASVDEAFGFNKNNNVLSSGDHDLLKKYHCLDIHGKKMVDFTLSEEYARCCSEEVEINDDNIIPYPQYPTVTKKDIKSFAARNKKKGITEEKIAELIYTLFPDGG